MRRALLTLAVVVAVAGPAAPAFADDICFDVSLTSPTAHRPQKSRICVPH